MMRAFNDVAHYSPALYFTVVSGSSSKRPRMRDRLKLRQRAQRLKDHIATPGDKHDIPQDHHKGYNKYQTSAFCYFALPVCTENLNPNVRVMKSAKDRIWRDRSDPLNRAKGGRIFIQ